nr:MAG TPA: hypothetical protein [Herelleviridae sp.]
MIWIKNMKDINKIKWSFYANDEGILIGFNNIFSSEIYGKEDFFGGEINYLDFANKYFDIEDNFTDLEIFFIETLEEIILSSLPDDLIDFTDYEKNKTYIDCISRARIECKEPLKKLFIRFREKEVKKLSDECKNIETLYKNLNSKNLSPSDISDIIKILESKIRDNERLIRKIQADN